MPRPLFVLALLLLANSALELADSAAWAADANPGANLGSAQPAPRAVQPKPQAARAKPGATALRPPDVFLPPARPAPLLQPGDGSTQPQPIDPLRASTLAHRAPRHSTTIFNSPAVESPRRFGPPRPVPTGPAPLKRRVFTW